MGEGESAPGRRNSKCKGPETAETQWRLWKNRGKGHHGWKGLKRGWEWKERRPKGETKD